MATIDLVATQDLDRFYLDLRGIEVSSITVDGKSLRELTNPGQRGRIDGPIWWHEQDDEARRWEFVVLTRPKLQAGRSAQVVIEYGGDTVRPRDIEGAKAAFQGTTIDNILPVACNLVDDRVERPEGIEPRIVAEGHTILAGLETTWPHLLGYNRVTLREEGELLATIGDDPLVAIRHVGAGRTAVFTSDCAPHWAPPSFSDEWPGYARLFDSLVRWLGTA